MLATVPHDCTGPRGGMPPDLPDVPRCPAPSEPDPIKRVGPGVKRSPEGNTGVRWVATPTRARPESVIMATCSPHLFPRLPQRRAQPRTSNAVATRWGFLWPRRPTLTPVQTLSPLPLNPLTLNPLERTAGPIGEQHVVPGGMSDSRACGVTDSFAIPNTPWPAASPPDWGDGWAWTRSWSASPW